MNIVLGAYYGTINRDQVKWDVDVSTPIALRTLWKAGRGNVKVSHIHPDLLSPTKVSSALHKLGGSEKASAALAEAKPWLGAWDEGEVQGRRVAESVMESIFEDAWIKASSKALTPTPQQNLNAAVSKLVRSL